MASSMHPSSPRTRPVKASAALGVSAHRFQHAPVVALEPGTDRHRFAIEPIVDFGEQLPPHDSVGACRASGDSVFQSLEQLRLDALSHIDESRRRPARVPQSQKPSWRAQRPERAPAPSDQRFAATDPMPVHRRSTGRCLTFGMFPTSPDPAAAHRKRTMGPLRCGALSGDRWGHARGGWRCSRLNSCGLLRQFGNK